MNCFAKFLAARFISIGHALNGLGHTLKTQGNTRVHLLATLLVVVAGLGFGIQPLEWVAITVAVSLVWVAELMNTALETLCDIVSTETSEKVKHAKDTAAAAVLVAAIGAVIIGALVFLPYLKR